MIQHRDVVNAVRDAIFLAEMDTGMIVDANHAAEALCGRSLAELRSLRYSELQPEYLAESPGRHFETHVPLPGVTEASVLHKDGRRIPVEIASSHFTASDGRRMLVGVFRDTTERGQAEQALLRQNEFIQAVLDNISDGVVACDDAGNLVLFNRTAREWHGIDALNLPPDQWSSQYDLFGPDGTSPLPTESIPLKRAHNGEQLHDVGMTIAAKGQPLRHLLASGRPFFDDRGHKLGAVVGMHDITERKQAEAALRESEERFRNMADMAPVLIWLSGPDNLGTFFNKTWLDFTGRTMSQELGNGWTSGVHPDDLQHCLGTCSASFDARKAFQIEFRLRRADGEYRWILDTGVPRYQHGEFIGFIGSCLDVTERKLIEERLRGSESRLKYAQRLARIGSWEREFESGHAYWADETFRIHGLPNDTPPTFSNFLTYVYPEDRSKVLEAHEQVHLSDAPVDIEFRINRPDGELRCVRTILNAVRNDSGAIVRTVGVTQDITDQKRAQEEILARQKLETVGTLASGIAHDFNNLLGGVLAHAELALAESAAGSHPETELTAIRDATIRGSEIVRQLMIYAGQETEVLDSVDLSRIVDEMVELLKFSVSKHALLTMDLDRNLPAIQAGAGQLRQIVMNLVTNASDAIGESDGVICVTTECVTVGQDGPWFPSEDLPEGDYVRLEVSDTGCGMPEEIQARVFDPFFTTKSAGHGLGLAVVQGTVRSLQGTVRVESERGKGTTFEVLLPCSRTPVMADQSAAFRTVQPRPDRQSHKGTVLIVEDEDSLRLPVSKLLRKAHFSVIEASDGSAALEAIRAHTSPIDILFLDITLPGTPSRTVFEEARRLRGDMSLIVTSAYSHAVAEERLGGKIQCFLRKPYLVNDLVRLVGQALSR